jgi:hypothetical protein
MGVRRDERSEMVNYEGEHIKLSWIAKTALSFM